MMRIVVLLLLLANAGFFAWQQGMVQPFVDAVLSQQPQARRAPQEINPDKLVIHGAPDPSPAHVDTGSAPAVSAAQANAVLDTVEPASAPSASSSAGTETLATLAAAPITTGLQCMEAGPYSREEEGQILAVLARALPANSWRVDRFPVPGLWLIYMGPYPDDATLKTKQGELQRIGELSYEEVRSPASLRMGISLGRFNSQAAADSALNAMQARGVRTARVVSVRPPMDVAVIRVPQADVQVQKQLQNLPLPPERGFVGCLAP